MANNKNKRLKILLVEDDEDDHFFISRALSKSELDFELTWAVDGDTALDHLKQFSVDIVLLDLNLPKKSGHEVLSEIRSSQNLSKQFVIILSNANSEDEIRKAYQKGANHYIVKKSSTLEMADSLNSLLGVTYLSL